MKDIEWYDPTMHSHIETPRTFSWMSPGHEVKTQEFGDKFETMSYYEYLTRWKKKLDDDSLVVLKVMAGFKRRICLVRPMNKEE